MKLHDLCAASMIFRQLAIWTSDDNERINFFFAFFVYCILHCFDSFELKSKYSIGSGLICSFSPGNWVFLWFLAFFSIYDFIIFLWSHHLVRNLLRFCKFVIFNFHFTYKKPSAFTPFLESFFT